MASIVDGSIAVLDTGEERLHRVVVALRDRIELVIVAAGTADREPEQRRTGSLNDLVQFVLARQPLRLVIFADLAGQQDRGRDQKASRLVGL